MPSPKRDPRPRYRPTGKCPLYRYETTGQLLHSEVGSNQVGCSCTWQRSLSCETNTGATKEVPAPYQGWIGSNHPTSNWPYQGHQIPYLVPRTTNWLSPLWSNTDRWPYAAGVCIVTGMSWLAGLTSQDSVTIYLDMSVLVFHWPCDSSQMPFTLSPHIWSTTTPPWTHSNNSNWHRQATSVPFSHNQATLHSS